MNDLVHALMIWMAASILFAYVWSRICPNDDE